MRTEEIVLDGESLSPEALYTASKTALDPNSSLKVRLSEKAWARVEDSSHFVIKALKKGKPIYGINTGFGRFAETSINDSQIEELQYNLIVSHACGVGELLPRDMVLALLIQRLNVIARGNSGVRRETVEQMIKLIEKGILADVPARGLVGASGDLAPSAHATLPLLGEGHCSMPVGGSIQKMSSSEALKKAGFEKWKLGAKEGLGLINGTQLTTAYTVWGLIEGEQLLKTANLGVALSTEGLRGTHTNFDERIFIARNQPATADCAREIRDFLEGPSEISKSHAVGDTRVQDPYSLRCAGVVHGAVLQELKECRAQLYHELNSSTDNPLLFPEDDVSLSGGNFHAIFTARLNDRLASAFTTLSNICERRIAMMMNKESNGLFTFLVKDGGLNSGFMIAHVTAAALVSESKSLCFPASVDSIPTNDDKEDHVSMGPIAGIKLRQIMNNVSYVLGIEILCASQAIDLLRPLKANSKLERVHARLRKEVKYLDKDRNIHPDIEKVCELVRSGELLRA